MCPNKRQSELIAAESECRKLTLVALPTEAPLLERTLDVMFAGFQIANALKVKTRWGQIILTLGFRAYDNIHLAHEALLNGYPVQAGAFGRAALEDFQTGMYINDNHAKARYWWARKYSRLKPAKEVPSFAELRKSFGPKLEQKLRVMYHLQSQMAHPRAAGLWMQSSESAGEVRFRIGAEFDADKARAAYYIVLPAAVLCVTLIAIIVDGKDPAWDRSVADLNEDAVTWSTNFKV